VNQEQLIRKLHAGHESAYEELFRTYYVELSNHAYKYLMDIEVAKEIVQDLFVNIYKKRDKLELNSSLKSYLYRSVHNRCLNHIKAQKTKEKYVAYIKYNSTNAENQIENKIYANELESALLNAISQLPPKCRMVFKMNRMEGLTNSEIAEKLELSKRTVETQITKALKILRTKIRPYLSECYLVLLILFHTFII